MGATDGKRYLMIISPQICPKSGKIPHKKKEAARITQKAAKNYQTWQKQPEAVITTRNGQKQPETARTGQMWVKKISKRGKFGQKQSEITKSN